MSLPTDDQFAQQWHLHNTVTGQYDLDVVKVWDDYTGKGIKVAVIDDGFDHDHPDLAPNYDVDLDKDFGSDPDDDDAAPALDDDNHGTSVMGIIGAARNGTGVVGVAYDATLIGYRITYDVATDVWTANFVNALDSAVESGAEVANMSFGGAYDYDQYTGADNVVAERAAIDHALTDGRGGLGIVLVKSAGNSRSSATDVNHNQEDNNTGEIIVAAVNRDGFISNYSSYGTPILVSGFGSPGGSAGEIVTTDRLGDNGYEAGDFMHTFNGTSAAAPMVSGVAALVLQANPDLGWRDVQTILADTARHVGSAVDGATIAGYELNPWNWNDATNWNGGGMHYSRDYGYGLVDAWAAVRLAESWTAVSTSANQKSQTLDVLDAATTVPDNNVTGATFTGHLDKSIDVERVTVTMDIQSDWISDLGVYLTGPDGHRYSLSVNQNNLATGAYTGTFTYETQAYRGVASGEGSVSAGDWSVYVTDTANSGYDTVLSDIKIKFYGSAASKSATYVYTDEFSDFTADGSHSKNLNDTDGGVDTLDAAAVSAASTVNLTKGTGKIDGVAMKIKGIEDVFGGDGNDRLTGNGSANALSGGRGKDVLAGGKGGDSFLYHVVADSLVGKHHDMIKGFGKGDHIDLSDIDTSAKDGDQGFRFLASKAFDGKHPAELDFDVTDKKGTAHDVTMVFADLDGDRNADFQIELTGAHALTKADFLL
jgi:subtilisin family serine protease